MLFPTDLISFKFNIKQQAAEERHIENLEVERDNLQHEIARLRQQIELQKQRELQNNTLQRNIPTGPLPVNIELSYGERAAAAPAELGPIRPKKKNII